MSPAVERMLLGNKPQFAATQKKHESFALEYLIDFDMVRAYKTVYDTSGTMEDIVAHKAASRLLNSVTVQRVIDEEECRIVGEKRLEKEVVIQQMQRLYLKAMKDRDYASARGALDMLCKHFGIYAAHNRQKKYQPEDVAAIRRKLEENGLSFYSPNMPKAIEQSGVIDTVQDAEIIKECIE